MKFDNTFQKLPKIFFEHVDPTPLSEPKLVAVSRRCADQIGIDLSDQDLTRWLNGQSRLEGDQRVSTRYAGHQFGVWAGQLGDGRAISLGEIINEKNERWEIQTKGSGLTPFSRMGDGKAVIRSSVREFLCSEAMHALGIPTTRALALITGSDSVHRESIEKSALVARAFTSNLRFGHFEYGFHFQEDEALKELADYALKEFYPECTTYSEMLEKVVLRTADMIAQWMSVGFCHGVMNSDNMSFLGQTIDYGPFGFLEDTNLQHVCNHSDHQGRYAYDRQPGIAFWNLDRLCLSFSEVVPVEDLKRVLEQFQPHLEQAWLRIFRQKLGLTEAVGHPESDQKLIEMLLMTMHRNRADFTSTFRRLSRPETKHLLGPGFSTWMQLYDQRLELEGQAAADRRHSMLAVNPKYVLRNYIAQEVIEEVEQGHSEKLLTWLKILESPFSEHSGFDHYAEPTPLGKKDLQVSCSS